MGMRGKRTARVHRPLEAAVHARARKRPLADARVHVCEHDGVGTGVPSRLSWSVSAPVWCTALVGANVLASFASFASFASSCPNSSSESGSCARMCGGAMSEMDSARMAPATMLSARSRPSRRSRSSPPRHRSCATTRTRGSWWAGFADARSRDGGATGTRPSRCRREMRSGSSDCGRLCEARGSHQPRRGGGGMGWSVGGGSRAEEKTARTSPASPASGPPRSAGEQEC